MRLLHLCSDYPFTNVYHELISRVDKNDIDQIVFIPVKRETDIGKGIDTSLQKAKYVYSNNYKNIDRFFYRHKRNKIFKDVKSKLDLQKIDLIHAHFLFSLGGIALKIKEQFGVEYIVSIRNVDINYFFKYGYWLRKLGIKILLNSRRIVFISPAHFNRIINRYIPSNLRREIAEKSIIVPNGINNFWHINNYKRIHSKNGNRVKLIFVGELKKNKNVETSIKVVIKLVELGWDASIIIIGRGPHEKELKKKYGKNYDYVKMIGFVNDKQLLLKYYRDADIFIMPSFKETFGLVFIEAMTQGLPVLYTKGEGIDGYFKEGEVGWPVKPTDVSEIVNKIHKIKNDYVNISKRCVEHSKIFKWDLISKEYVEKIICNDVKKSNCLIWNQNS